MNSKMMALAFSFLGLVASFYSQETKTVSSWKKYKFSNFLLTIDPQDEMNKTYIYQEVNPNAPFPPILETVNNFFIGVNKLNQMGKADQQMGENGHIGVPLESNPGYIVSLVTGEVYRRNVTEKLTQVMSIYPLEHLENIRPALRQAINIRMMMPDYTE